MSGYQEILTDPSYCRQLVTLTYPHIGNTGTTPEDNESGGVYVSGLIIRDLPVLHSSWRASESLPEFLTRENMVAIAGIDASNAASVIGAGVDGVAVISALSAAGDPEMVARELRAIVDAARRERISA
jgi:carbamoyl-phosphate synthase small subunit